MEIRARNEEARTVLNAAANGQVDVLKETSDSLLNSARCDSGCTALHYAAGCNQLSVIHYLIQELSITVDILATRQAKGRTPLHYACRNGCLEAAKLLVDEFDAEPDVRARHGVSPFQLAVWQNQLELCKWLVGECHVDPCQVNSFECGAVHWIAICPQRQSFGLLDLAQWLSEQSGIDFTHKQRQGHTPLHKAAWGGHLDLIRYLRDVHGLLDDSQDDAGNYAADLADMANTPHHARVAEFLRRECNGARAKSCAIIGIPVGSSREDIRKAYLVKARQVHPDRQYETKTGNGMNFDSIRRAYEHLMFEDGTGNQSNPTHSLHLMLKITSQNNESKEEEDDGCFQARLIAVLLEYGDKGLDLANVKKKWGQLWPKTPFPGHKGGLSEFIRQRAGSVVEIVVNEKGSVRVLPKRHTQSQVARVALEQQGVVNSTVIKRWQSQL